jgi:hypothetical protein
MEIEFVNIEKQWHKAFKLKFNESELSSSNSLHLEFREAYFGCNVLLMKGSINLYRLNDLGKEKLKDFFSKLSLYNWGEKQENYNNDKRACSTVIAQLGSNPYQTKENIEILEKLGFITISHVMNSAHTSETNRTSDRQKLFLWSVNNIKDE